MSSKILLNETNLSLRNDLHIPRKLWHMATGLTGLGLYLLSNLSKDEMGKVLLLLGVIALLFDSLRLKISALNKLTIKIMKPFMRKSEVTGYSGFSFYALGAGLTMLFYDEKIAILAICFLIFADPVSSLFGILYGNKKILPNKSLQGTLAGGICCFFVSLIYSLIYIGFSDTLMLFVFLSAVCGGLAELASFQLDDNLTLPVFSGFLLTIVNSLMQLY